MKRKLIASAAILTTLATISPVFAQTQSNSIKEGNYTLIRSQIIVSGKTEMTPYVFAAKDPNSGAMTTFIPIWYIMQVLKQNGNQVTWTRFKQPSMGDLAVQTSTYNGNLNINGKINGASIMINGSEAGGETGIPNYVLKDPNSKVKTTFFGLFYAEKMLDSLGYTNTWNGTSHTWTITPPKAKPVIAANSTNIQKAIAQAQANVKTGKITVYGMLSTPTQWYNDPSVKFYDKSFPVSDLKDGFVIQKNPYTVVLTNTDASYPVIAEYIGYGSNSIQGKVTFWENEAVNKNTGAVIAIIPYMILSMPSGDKGATAPSDGQGINFGNHAGPVMKNYNVNWAAGSGLDAVPIPNWSPLIK